MNSTDTGAGSADSDSTTLRAAATRRASCR